MRCGQSESITHRRQEGTYLHTGASPSHTDRRKTPIWVETEQWSGEARRAALSSFCYGISTAPIHSRASRVRYMGSHIHVQLLGECRRGKGMRGAAAITNGYTILGDAEAPCAPGGHVWWDGLRMEARRRRRRSVWLEAGVYLAACGPEAVALSGSFAR
ncbi:hypothetical protein HYPSUDRAFT_1045887 [Hypholoma sublateritium FD-334 SS-4]|uniref:Uncharacterized protein n=1 Tax=Hypholoma sublateritium (strain FD-334 SS-4) TaxID=945553 RepID=A0A0D2NK91_HYPSF|nr:hypothetical protein HYPSUDRAFT_1045887 [Hypholoma sublateritium FD-334 SS-4]